MKLFGALLACASALTDDEIAAFKCRSGTYAQYDRVSSNGGTEMNRRASSKFRELTNLDSQRPPRTVRGVLVNNNSI